MLRSALRTLCGEWLETMTCRELKWERSTGDREGDDREGSVRERDIKERELGCNRKGEGSIRERDIREKDDRELRCNRKREGSVREREIRERGDREGDLLMWDLICCGNANHLLAYILH